MEEHRHKTRSCWSWGAVAHQHWGYSQELPAGSGIRQWSHWDLRCPELSSSHPRSQSPALPAALRSCCWTTLHCIPPHMPDYPGLYYTKYDISPSPMAERGLRIFVSRDSKCPHFSMTLFFTKIEFSDLEDFSRISRSEQSCQLLSDCCTCRNPTHTHSRATVALQNSNFEQHCIYQTCMRTVAVQLHHQQNLLDGQNAYAVNS